jgi:hypothetical protein
VTSPGTTQPAQGFNDIVLTNWLAANRGIVFNESQGWVKSIWVGGVNPAAVFFITGDTSNVGINDLNLYVPAGAGAHAFMPMAFSASANWKNNQTVTNRTPETTRYAAVPHDLAFDGINLDGTLMGWQGNLQTTMFYGITSNRYSDLQDAAGGHVGGIGKWFPPPHLFYINTHAADTGLNNNNLTFVNVNDEGVRVGTARDKGGGDTISGYANSLKLGCSACSVENYISRRPDGFMDVLPSNGLTLNSVFASFDSQFLNNLYPAGIRFPGTGYSNVQFVGVTLQDTAANTIRGPISNATSSSNNAIAFVNFQGYMTTWSGNNLPLPTIKGTNNDIALNFAMSSQLMTVSYLQNRDLQVTVKGSPTTVNHGAATALDWGTTEANQCNAGGAWSGNVGTSGSRTITLPKAGGYTFTLTCKNSAASSSTSLRMYAN